MTENWDPDPPRESLPPVNSTINVQLGRKRHLATQWDEKVELNAGRLPAVPILMELGALTVGADLFDPNKKIILLTEDKIVGPVIALAEANGAGVGLATLSYNGCGNLSGARQLARSLITDMRADVRVIIHRDRDFRTDEEMRFEELNFLAWCNEEKLERIKEIFSPLNDVEHSFAQIGHLVEVFDGLISQKEIKSIVSDTIAEQRDEQTGLIRSLRSAIGEKLYSSERYRKKDSWAAAGMPSSAPKVADFLPATGKEPLTIDQCHGKTLLRALKPRLHCKHEGLETEDLSQRLFKASPSS